jgi:hypothetical protein
MRWITLSRPKFHSRAEFRPLGYHYRPAWNDRSSGAQEE